MESKNITQTIEQNYDKRTWSQVMPAYSCGDHKLTAKNGGVTMSGKYDWLKKKGLICRKEQEK